jgi:hypothetical protein
MDQLILKRAHTSRPSGHWSEDDYDVLSEGEVVGDIMKVVSAPEDTPWMWRWPTGITATARQRMASRPRARLRWPPSLRAGDGHRDYAVADGEHTRL